MNLQWGTSGHLLYWDAASIKHFGGCCQPLKAERFSRPERNHLKNPKGETRYPVAVGMRVLAFHGLPVWIATHAATSL